MVHLAVWIHDGEAVLEGRNADFRDHKLNGALDHHAGDLCDRVDDVPSTGIAEITQHFSQLVFFEEEVDETFGVHS